MGSINGEIGEQQRACALAPGDRVRLKKPHPCGCADFVVTRTGADVKLRCEKCGRVVLLDSGKAKKQIKIRYPQADGGQKEAQNKSASQADGKEA